MTSKIGEIECLFCDNLITFYDGETGIYQSHLELKHEVEVAKKELVIAFCFLREKELHELLNKIQPRKEYFLEHGEEEIDDENDEELDEELEEKLINCDIYVDKSIVEASPRVEDQSTEQIEQMLSDDFSFETSEIPKFNIHVTNKFHTRDEQKDGKYSCNQCESTYSARSNLRRHQASVHEGLTYSCDHCEYFAPRDNLNRHLKTVHSTDNYLCKVCDYQTRNQRSLKTHQLQHTGDKPHLCTSCPKSFSRSGSLIIHQLTHTKDKSFKCPTCTKLFTQSAHLKEHQLVHSSSKSFTCEICAKEFSQPRSLRRHQLIHNSAKLFQCEECGYSCNRSSSFTEHMNKHKTNIDI
jgi:uncharacterized Zn-finger protein